jgi:Phosphatidylinositol 3- and 4-kinase
MSEHETQAQEPQNTPTPISTERVIELLKTGEICAEHGLMRWSSNYAFLVTLIEQDQEITAVYKPQKGERPLWDFPDGTLCYREFASFLTSQELDWQIVPPTVLREGSRGLGSFQFFIDHDPDVNYFTFDDSMHPQLMPMVIFDAIVNNADRKGGHCLLDARGQLWGIDHGISFNAAHKLRTVIWDFAGQPIPAEYLEDVEKLSTRLMDTTTPYRRALEKLLSRIEIEAFSKRIQQILRLGKFPLPGNGPNYPWPPV